MVDAVKKFRMLSNSRNWLANAPMLAGHWSILRFRTCENMIDDMMMRKLSPKTQSGYIRAVKNLARYLGRSPDTATAEELRKYQLSLVNDGISRITLNANLTALKFFFATTLDRADENKGNKNSQRIGSPGSQQKGGNDHGPGGRDRKGAFPIRRL